MYVNGMPFLTTISKNIKYHTAMWVADCTAPTITYLVESVLKIISTGQLPGHGSVCRLRIQASSPHPPRWWMVLHDLANAQEQVTEAECNNCILEECICTTYHGIPYKMLPRTVICYMVMETTAKLNYFPAKGSCSNYFSLREILHHVKLDTKKHCSMPHSQ